MLLPAIRKECRSIWRDGRFRWTAAVLLLALALSTAIGLRLYRQRMQARDEAELAQREQWLHKTASNAHIAAHQGITLFRPLDPLAALDSGIDSYVGVSVYLEPHRRSLFANAALERAPRSGRFPELTVAIALQVVAPLLIILLTFPSFAAEREQGTLCHLLSLGVHPGRLAIAKAIGLTLPLFVILLPAILVGIRVLTPRALLFVAAYGLYFAIFAALGILVSATSRTSQNALLVLIGLWVVTCFLIPRSAFAIASALATASPAIEAVEGEGGNFMQQRSAIERRLLAQYRVTSAVDLPVSTWGMTLYEREIESTERYNRQFARLFDSYARQQRIVDWLSFLSPPLAMKTLSMSLAGSDVAHYRDFAEAAERYRYDLVQRMNQLAVESRLYNSSPNLASLPDQPAFPQGERAAYASVPPFEYRAPAAGWAFRQAGLAAIALAAWLLLAIASAAVVFRRLEIE
jgi:ABC-2 type transport system permease protein